MIPFVKWAGGKRWLFGKDFIDTLPKFKRYIEPFLGGGAGFFTLEPASAILSDLNPELILMYRVVRDAPRDLEQRLRIHQEMHSKSHYYEVRSRRPSSDLEAAARFLYLNRSCWNGLYRLNLRGDFNVPIGTKSQIILPTDDFAYASELLKRADLRTSDFECVIDEAKSGDLVFVDPPYTVAHNNNGFVKYNEKIFSWDDQVRLRDAVKRACARGASVVLTNADHNSVHSLYSEIGTVCSVTRSSVISGNPKGRNSVTEVLVRL